MQVAGRIYYRKEGNGVVIEKDGRDVADYPSVEALVETHIKGLLAIQERDAKPVTDLLRKYRTPSGLPFTHYPDPNAVKD